VGSRWRLARDAASKPRSVRIYQVSGFMTVALPRYQRGQLMLPPIPLATTSFLVAANTRPTQAPGEHSSTMNWCMSCNNASAAQAFLVGGSWEIAYECLIQPMQRSAKLMPSRALSFLEELIACQGR